MTKTTKTQTTKFRVVRKDNGPMNPHTGLVSNHRTREAAERAVEQANRGLRRTRGYENARHPYAVQEFDGTYWS